MSNPPLKSEHEFPALACPDVDAARPVARPRGVWFNAPRRTLDILLAVILVVVTLPLTIIAAIAIRIDSQGPVLYRQVRVGRRGRRFTILKLRTMTLECPRAVDVYGETGALPLRDSRDPRLTRVGRFLRRSFIDEIPQGINVIRGDMSIVGPRPLIPEEQALLGPLGDDRLAVRPGITGPWQVMPNRAPIAEMATIDADYIATRTLVGDLRLVVRTAWQVLSCRGV